MLYPCYIDNNGMYLLTRLYKVYSVYHCIYVYTVLNLLYGKNKTIYSIDFYIFIRKIKLSSVFTSSHLTF